jgi:multiple sugar transport system substrate-binding protein
MQPNEHKRHWHRRPYLFIGAATLVATLAATVGSPGVLARAPHAKITLTIWSPENRPADAQAHAWLIGKFEAAHPDIAVRLTTTTWDDHFTRIQAAKAAGNLPDLIYSYEPNTSAMVSQGVIQDVGDIVKELGTANFPPGQLLQMRTSTGGVDGIPFFGVPHSIFYRIDFFRQAGVKPPTSWSGFLDVAKKLTRDGHKGVCLFNKGLDAYYILDFMIAGGAHVTDAKGNTVIDSPQTIKVLQLIKTINDNGWTVSGWNAYNMDDAKLPFMAGKCAMVINSTSFLNELQTKAPGLLPKVGTFAIPIDAPGKYAGQAGTSQYTISATTPNHAAAKMFLEFMFRKDIYEGFIGREVLGFIPVYKPAVTDPAFYKQPRIAPLAAAYRGGLEALARGGPLLGAEYGAGPSSKIGSQVYNEQIYTLMADKILQGQSPAAVAKWAAQQVDRIKASQGM